MPNRILRLRTVLDRTGLSRTTMYRKIGEGTFPQQLRISVHGAGWSEESSAGSPTPQAIALRPTGADQAIEGRRSGTTLSDAGAKQYAAQASISLRRFSKKWVRL